VKREDVELIAGLCRSRAGLKVDPEKIYLIESRLSPLARRESFGSIGDMIRALRDKRDDKLAWAIVEAMTLNETSFFRDREVFDFLGAEAIPHLARLRAASGKPLRIWSAGCATGQEVYSLAMQIDAARSVLGGTQVELYGSDLSERCMEKAQSGLFTQFEVQRGLPIRQLIDYFEKQEEMWLLSPRIRQMARWKRVNLLSDLSALGRFDLILCRNVVSQMDANAKVRVLEGLAPCLSPEGLLVLGAQETAATTAQPFTPVAGRPGLYSRNPAFRAAA
jgi:chemotaxis protein methyltransferase CheR